MSGVSRRGLTHHYRELTNHYSRRSAAWRREAYNTRIDAAHALTEWLEVGNGDVAEIERLRDDLMILPDAPRPADETEERR